MYFKKFRCAALLLGLLGTLLMGCVNTGLKGDFLGGAGGSGGGGAVSSSAGTTVNINPGATLVSNSQHYISLVSTSTLPYPGIVRSHNYDMSDPFTQVGLSIVEAH